MSVIWHCDLCGAPARRVAVRRGTAMVPIRRTPACDDCFERVDLELRAPIEAPAVPYAWMDAKDAGSDREAARTLIVQDVMGS